MKKNILIVAGGCLLLLMAGCSWSSKKTIPMTTTGTVVSGEVIVSGEILQSGMLLTGEQNPAFQEVTNSEISGLLDERATQPVATGKLTEDDITLLEKVIQKVESITSGSK